MFRLLVFILFAINFFAQGMGIVPFLQYEQKLKELEKLFEQVDIFDKSTGSIGIFLIQELVPFMKKNSTQDCYKDLFTSIQTHQGCMLFVEFIHRKNHWCCDHSNILKSIREFVPIAQTIYEQHTLFRNSFVCDRAKQIYTDQDFSSINPNYSWKSNGIYPTCLLVVTAAKNNVSLFKALMERGADPNPWLFSLFQCNNECLKSLIHYKTQLKKEKIFNSFALEHNYIDNTIVEKINLLLKLGIDKDLSDNINQCMNVICDFTKPRAKRKRDENEIENCSKIIDLLQTEINNRG